MKNKNKNHMWIEVLMPLREYLKDGFIELINSFNHLLSKMLIIIIFGTCKSSHVYFII